MKNTKKALTILMTGGLAVSAAAQQRRPNFVWFMTEDVSKHYLSLYNGGEYGASTPNVERLAAEGVVFANAYSNAPVSSAARTTLITGCYAPRLGGSFHRKLRPVPMPEGLNMFPYYLRKAGYHTSNAAKTDYNCMLDKEAWDVVAGKMGEWRNRPDKDMPFFFVRTNDCTHEGKLHFKVSEMDSAATSYAPREVRVAPYHPDTELFRYTYARFFDRIEESDRELGQLMAMLEEDGLLDDTFIFYFGDNGGALPGTKGYTTEPGVQVPLVVYVPEKWREPLHVGAGSVNRGLVSFMDLGPTLLHLAGIKLPEEMDGAPILGEDVTEEALVKRDVCCYGDRFDELYAFNRTLRRGNYKYSRNFQPYHSKSLYAFYRYKQAAFREWARMYEAGELDAAQSHFFEPQGPEELYDLSKDPHELVNLAGDPRYAEQLREMRAALKQKLVGMHDLGFYPECEWLKGAADPTEFGKRHAEDIRRYSDLADLQLLPFAEAREGIRRALHSEDPVDRYWGATLCASFGKPSEVLSGDLQALLADPRAYVRSRAAVALSICAELDPVEAMKTALQMAASGSESLLVLNDMAWAKENLGCSFALKPSNIVRKCKGTDWRLNYLE